MNTADSTRYFPRFDLALKILKNIGNKAYGVIFFSFPLSLFLCPTYYSFLVGARGY